MMPAYRRHRWPTLLATLMLVTIAAIAQAHGGSDAARHMTTYEQEIDTLVDKADAIVADYAAGRPVADRVDALVDDWEHADFHQAVETKATLLYPPIWVALGKLSAAVDKKSAPDGVRRARDCLAAALHEGVGALKYLAARPGASAGQARTGSMPAPDSRSPVAAIQAELERAVADYRQQNVKAAVARVHRTYMQRFEGIEGELIERDADLVTALEKDFNATLPMLMKRGAPLAEVQAEVQRMNADLDSAGKLLDKAARNHGKVF